MASLSALKFICHYSGLFQSLGVPRLLGCTFVVRQDGTVILTHQFWKSHLGADPKILGRSLTFNGSPFAVVGVMSPGFDLFGRGGSPFVATDLHQMRRLGMISVAALEDGSGPSFASSLASVLSRRRQTSMSSPATENKPILTAIKGWASESCRFRKDFLVVPGRASTRFWQLSLSCC